MKNPFHGRAWWWWVLWLEAALAIGVLLFSIGPIVPQLSAPDGGWGFIILLVYVPLFLLLLLEFVALTLGRGGRKASTALTVVGIIRILIRPVLFSLYVFLFSRFSSINEAQTVNQPTLFVVLAVVERLFGGAVLLVGLFWNRLEQKNNFPQV